MTAVNSDRNVNSHKTY